MNDEHGRSDQDHEKYKCNTYIAGVYIVQVIHKNLDE